MKPVEFCGNLTPYFLNQILDDSEAFLGIGDMWLLTPDIRNAFSMCSGCFVSLSLRDESLL